MQNPVSAQFGLFSWVIRRSGHKLCSTFPLAIHFSYGLLQINHCHSPSVLRLWYFVTSTRFAGWPGWWPTPGMLHLRCRLKFYRLCEGFSKPRLTHACMHARTHVFQGPCIKSSYFTSPLHQWTLFCSLVIPRIRSLSYCFEREPCQVAYFFMMSEPCRHLCGKRHWNRSTSLIYSHGCILPMAPGLRLSYL